MNIDQVLTHLEGVRKNGSGYYARCPAHDDGRQSLSVKVGDKGGILSSASRAVKPRPSPRPWG